MLSIKQSVPLLLNTQFIPSCGSSGLYVYECETGILHSFTHSFRKGLPGTVLGSGDNGAHLKFFSLIFFFN